MDNDVMSLLIKQITEDVERMSQVISEGAAADFAQYKYLCGQVIGLNSALNYVKAMEQRLQRAED